MVNIKNTLAHVYDKSKPRHTNLSSDLDTDLKELETIDKSIGQEKLKTDAEIKKLQDEKKNLENDITAKDALIKQKDEEIGSKITKDLVDKLQAVSQMDLKKQPKKNADGTDMKDKDGNIIYEEVVDLSPLKILLEEIKTKGAKVDVSSLDNKFKEVKDENFAEPYYYSFIRLKGQSIDLPVIFKIKTDNQEPPLKKGTRIELTGNYSNSEKNVRKSFTAYSYQLLNEKRIRKKCIGCCDTFTCYQSQNYDYCKNCELNGSRYVPRENKCSECGDEYTNNKSVKEMTTRQLKTAIQKDIEELKEILPLEPNPDACGGLLEEIDKIKTVIESQNGLNDKLEEWTNTIRLYLNILDKFPSEFTTQSLREYFKINLKNYEATSLKVQQRAFNSYIKFKKLERKFYDTISEGELEKLKLAKAQLLTIQQLLGHSSVQTTENQKIKVFAKLSQDGQPIYYRHDFAKADIINFQFSPEDIVEKNEKG
ncbi:19221_t:CDS:2 [Racocetra fulgida]|uniref:19221_t:CDS:1 n=1 Tax=Racocetra fulgida TaxID=60492 RepID=A0A9N8V989_9GLOM|nr:19221_t:CDS:2 [Racocetra fulgida]